MNKREKINKGYTRKENAAINALELVSETFPGDRQIVRDKDKRKTKKKINQR